MNRQQRRQAERLSQAKRDAENKILKSNKIEVELYFTAFGLALYNLYGWNNAIYKVWRETDKQISRIINGDAGFYDLKKELKAKTGAECSFR